jgi:glutamate/tyrosine decarboxylase-like PLP-dependent enzyme
VHDWDAATDLFAHSVIGYAIERVRLPMDTRWGARSASELDAALRPSITAAGVGGHEALRLARDVIMPSCRPMDDPLNLAYVPTAPTIAATMFDLVVSASSIFGGAWEAGAGAIAAENAAIRWLADLAGFPADAGGVFVSGGSAANLSALVTARHRHRARNGRSPRRLAFAATTEVHASVRATAQVMDVEVLTVEVDDRDRMTAAALIAALDAETDLEVFAVVASAGTTNVGAVDELEPIGEVCSARGLWLHVDGAYGLAALCSAEGRRRLAGIERADSFGVDPHKWLFAPYDCAALVYRDPSVAAAAHSQHGSYLDHVDRTAWNPSDYAYHLSRRARGLPLWFSLATYGTAAYAAAMDHTLDTAAALAAEIRRRPELELLLDPELSIVVFRRRGWTRAQYVAWSERNARDGVALVVPTSRDGEPCLRMCIVHPNTTMEMLIPLLDQLSRG